MAATTWKGHLTFGLVSIPVKLTRAARAEKVSFRQLSARTGTRVRQQLVAEEPEPEVESKPPTRVAAPAPSAQAAFRAEAPAPPPARGKTASARKPEPEPEPEPEIEQEPEPRTVSRSEIVKGYEFARDQYVTLSKEELASLTPETAREMQILEFVRLEEVDPIYFETSFYVAPDKGGEKAYALLLEALRQSKFVGLAQLAMQRREHVVVVRPGHTGIVLHTMFYENEVHRDDEYRADIGVVAEKELELAKLLIENLAAPFEPAKYRDTYREKLEALIEAKLEGREVIEAPPPKPAAVVNILDALQRSLQATPAKKPAASEAAAEPAKRAAGSRRKSSRKSA
jgi:DNA end-binding protein Ku